MNSPTRLCCRKAWAGCPESRKIPLSGKSDFVVLSVFKILFCLIVDSVKFRVEAVDLEIVINKRVGGGLDLSVLSVFV